MRARSRRRASARFEVFDFAREGKRPDGSAIKLAFSLAFAADPTSPNVRFAVCQHHFPENFWNPAFQTHANGARRVPGVVLVADNPTDHHIFLKAFTGVTDLHLEFDRRHRATENGDVEILAAGRVPRSVRRHVRANGEGMTLNALRFEVADLAQTKRCCGKTGWPATAMSAGCRGAARCRPWRNPDIRAGKAG